MAEAITIARPYATALFRMAKERNELDKRSNELSFLAAVAADEQAVALIDNPKLTSAELENIFLRICEGKLDEQSVNLVKLLVEYGRLNILPEISVGYELLKADFEGSLDAEIIAAAALTDDQVAKLVKQLEARFGKKIEAQVKVDPQIIGGIKIVVGDTVIDASVRGKLQELAYTLKG